MNRVEILEDTIKNCEEVINKCYDIIEITKKDIAEIKKENQEQWKPTNGELYYYYNKDTEFWYSKIWHGDRIDNLRLENKLIFKTIKEVERYANYQKAKRDYTYEFTQEEWENEHIGKYYIYYKAMSRKINIDSNWFYRVQGCDYFKSEEKAQEFIDKYESEILEYEFGIVGECYVRDR